MKTAIVFGASGLVGGHLVNELIGDDRYSKIFILGRKELPIKNAKIEQLIVDLFNFESYSDKVIGDDLFCALGTTIKKAGSQAQFRKVDFELPVGIAKLAEQNNIKGYYLVSSIGANAKSSTFYLRVKGETEDAITHIGLNRFISFRPSMLLGNRAEFRMGEIIGKSVMKAIGFLFIGSMKKYRGIEASSVAFQINLVLCKKNIPLD